ncbi:hypothetical protein Q3C19_06030 [Bacteroides sp. ET489]|uniref:hypothetical protein n=1 Tax=Bacteroides sp. ET489 TaxID=3057126 RepID=UPI002670FCA4|nr:hypothetical protein [Bacteroides sp. ET489]MDO3390031.1 hypothetical protein [Bacteroides sp. ET489]
MENNNQKGFASVSTPDGRYRIWMPRPTSSGRLVCSCSFALKKRLPLVDAIDALPYIQVEEIRDIDEDYSTFIITCKETPYHACMERLIEDLPKLMEEHLTELK